MFELTVLCEEYDTIEVLKPYWNAWVVALPPTLGTDFGLMQRLRIAYTLGYQERYKHTIWSLCATTMRKNYAAAELFHDLSSVRNFYEFERLRVMGALSN